MILVQKGLIYNPVKKLALDIEMHTQLWLATRVNGIIYNCKITYTCIIVLYVQYIQQERQSANYTFSN